MSDVSKPANDNIPYGGGCPWCGGNDGWMADMACDIWHYCRAHRTKWRTDKLSSNRHMSADDILANHYQLQGFDVVEPLVKIGPLDDPLFPVFNEKREARLQEMKPFLEGRKEAGRRIDPNSTDLAFGYFFAELDDPYGVLHLAPECSCIGRRYFARSPDSGGWVDFDDLPDETADVLERRIRAGELVYR